MSRLTLLKRNILLSLLLIFSISGEGEASDSQAGAAKTHLSTGLKAYNQRKFPLAVDHLSRAIQEGGLASGETVQALYHRGDAYIRSNEPAKGIADLSRALFLKDVPKDLKIKILQSRANAYKAVGLSSPAQADLQAIKLEGGVVQQFAEVKSAGSQGTMKSVDIVGKDNVQPREQKKTSAFIVGAAQKLSDKPSLKSQERVEQAHEEGQSIEKRGGLEPAGNQKNQNLAVSFSQDMPQNIVAPNNMTQNVMISDVQTVAVDVGSDMKNQRDEAGQHKIKKVAVEKMVQVQAKQVARPQKTLSKHASVQNKQGQKIPSGSSQRQNQKSAKVVASGWGAAVEQAPDQMQPAQMVSSQGKSNSGVSGLSQGAQGYEQSQQRQDAGTEEVVSEELPWLKERQSSSPQLAGQPVLTGNQAMSVTSGEQDYSAVSQFGVMQQSAQSGQTQIQSQLTQLNGVQQVSLRQDVQTGWNSQVDISKQKIVQGPEKAVRKSRIIKGLAAHKYLLQLAAVETENDARKAWAQLVAKHAQLLAGQKPHYKQATVHEKKVVRLQIGPFADRDSAVRLCDFYKQNSLNCFIAVP